MSAVVYETKLKETELPTLFEDFLGKLARHGRKEGTITSNRGALARFTQWIAAEGISVDDVTGDDMARYITTTGLAPNTMRLHAIKLKAAFDYGVRTRRTEADPFHPDDGYRVPPEVKPEIQDKLISSRDLRSMRGKCESMTLSPNALTLWALLTYTGMRSNEVRTLQWSDIDLDDEQVIRLRSVNAKGGKSRVIPIHPELGDILRRRRDEHDRKPVGHVLTPVYSVQKSNGKTLTVVGGRGTKKAGDPYSAGTGFERLLKSFAPECGFHAFRKTVANSLYRGGVQDGVVKAMLGWASKEVMMNHYIHIDPAQMRTAILRLYENDPV
jgi:integrase